jgi:FkbM family methyltransferase
LARAVVVNFNYLCTVFVKVKNSIKYILQRMLGFRTYLYVFALVKIRTLKSDAKEKDFFHFLSLLKDGNGDVLDIGANIGIMTVHLSKKLPNSTVHAIEPIPDNISVLKRIIGHFGLTKIKVYETAVGEEEGRVSMILPHQGKTRMQGLSHVKHESITEWNDGEEFQVPLTTLDQLLNGQRIQGIKIDVENFEYFALKGGTRVIETNQPVIYTELWNNENRTRCMELLVSLNYAPFVVVRGELIPFQSAQHVNQNFIFLPN